MAPSPSSQHPASSNLRARHARNQPSSSSDNDSIISDSDTDTQAIIASEDRAQISLLDILRILGGICLILGLFSLFVTGSGTALGSSSGKNGEGRDLTFGLWKRRPWWVKPGRLRVWWNYPLLLPPSALSLYNGTDKSLPIYLALNSTIYDVSASPHLYGQGGGYHFFAGRDATRAFVTGCFEDEEQLVGDLRGVEEMFLPIDDEDDGRDSIDKGAVTKEERRRRKLQREQEKRKARKQVEETIRGWKKTYEENKEGKYWPVGEVVWGEGRDAKERGKQPPELCQRAMDGRPKREKG